MSEVASGGGAVECLMWPEIAEHILALCNGRTLAVALRVCKMWHQQAKRILNSRRQWMSYMSEAGTVEDCMDELQGELSDVPFFPAAALVISSFPSLAKVKAGLCRILPASCHLVGACAEGIMGMVNGRTRSEEEAEPGVTVVLVPRLPSVYFSAFSMSAATALARNSKLAEKAPVQLIAERGDGLDEMGLPRQAVDDVRCVVVLASSSSGVMIGDKIRECYGPDVAIVGAITRHVKKKQSPLLMAGPASTNASKASFDTVCLVMAGRIHCATKCLSRGFSWPHCAGSLDDLTTRYVSASGKETLGAIFSCCGLGVEFFNKQNHEISELAKVVPHVPVIGMFGNGEISSHSGEVVALHFGPDGSKSCAKSVMVADLIRSYSSVFCLWSLLPPE